LRYGALTNSISGVLCRDPVGVFVDALHQDAGEKEIREDDDAPITQARRMLQPRLDQRKGHAGIAGFAPAEAETFPEHAHDLGHVGIGIRVGGAAADHHQQGLVPGNRIARLYQRLLDARSGSA